VKEYELYVPLFLNDGTPVPDGLVDDVIERLLDHFGGCTFFPNPTRASGKWLMLYSTMTS
jgi:hypothetical protein